MLDSFTECLVLAVRYDNERRDRRHEHEAVALREHMARLVIELAEAQGEVARLTAELAVVPSRTVSSVLDVDPRNPV